MPNAIATLFSGGEGAGTGARAAGLHHIRGIEIDDAAAQVARDNGFDVETADILKVNPADYPTPTVLQKSVKYDIMNIATTVYVGAFSFKEPALSHLQSNRVSHKAPATWVTPAPSSQTCRPPQLREFCAMHSVPKNVIIAVDTIRVRLGGANKQHYHQRGYNVYGKDYATVLVKDMPKNSGVEVSIICPRCQKQRRATIQRINRTEYTYCAACVKHIQQFQDITGKRFRQLTAIKPVGQDNQGATKWLCMCDCGRETVTTITRLNNGLTNSCGCLRIARTIEANSGKGNPNYNPNLTDEDRVSRRVIPEYREWQGTIKKRDNYTCQKCGARGKIVSHHLNAWGAFPEQRFNLDNGVTLCKTCHDDFHRKYGRGDNTREQYLEWAGA